MARIADWRSTCTLAISLMLASLSVRANVIRAINEARAEGCGGHPGIAVPLRSSGKLGEVARRMARGQTMRNAMDDTGYHGIKSSSIHMGGVSSDAAVARTFSKRFCSSLGDGELREIGYYRKGGEMWFVLAQPFSMLPLHDQTAVARRVLALINEARSHARRCGLRSFVPAGPLTLSTNLNRAALAHSRDMARNDYFEHEGRNGSTPSQRVTEAGYKWRIAGENLAAGVTTPEEAVQGWLESPHHCANLMDPRFTETGVGFAVNPASKLGIYWTQVFAVPR